MAYRRFRRGRSFRRRGYYGLHGQIRHRSGRRGIRAHIAANRAYRKMIRRPKRTVVKAYANTVGQIVYRSGRRRPSHRRSFRRRRYGRF